MPHEAERTSTDRMPRRVVPMVRDQLLGVDPTTLVREDLEEIRIGRGQCDAHRMIIQHFQPCNARPHLPGQGGGVLRIGPDDLILEEPEQLVLDAVGTQCREAIDHIRSGERSTHAIHEAGVIVEAHPFLKRERVDGLAVIDRPGGSQRGPNGKVPLIETHQTLVDLGGHPMGRGAGQAEREQGGHVRRLIHVENAAVVLPALCLTVPDLFRGGTSR